VRSAASSVRGDYGSWGERRSSAPSLALFDERLPLEM
jgi:hypothetical protein